MDRVHIDPITMQHFDWIENKLLAKKSLSSTKNVKPNIINTNNPGTRVWIRSFNLLEY